MDYDHNEAVMVSATNVEALKRFSARYRCAFTTPHGLSEAPDGDSDFDVEYIEGVGFATTASLLNPVPAGTPVSKDDSARVARLLMKLNHAQLCFVSTEEADAAEAALRDADQLPKRVAAADKAAGTTGHYAAFISIV